MKRRLNVDLVQSIRKLDVVSRRITSGKVVGGYKSVFKGKGLDFDGYRVYDSSDDASLIDWKATVRSNQILIKTYIEERDVNVFFLVDVSNSMVFGSTPKLKNEYAVETISSISHAILKEGDNVGMILFSDKIVCKVYPGKGEEQFYILTKNLINPENYGGNFDFNSACKFLLSYLKQDSIVFVVSDFFGLKEGWIKYLEMVSKKFDVIGMMIRDPRDRELPKNSQQIVVQDPYSNKSLIIEPELIKEVYEEHIKKQEKELRSEFYKSGAEFISLSTDKGFVNPIMNLFRQRSLKWR